jgi:phosphohistidine phosphatase
MKTLLLMRHAKSSWKDTELKDFDRPLTKKGKKCVLKMGRLIADEELVPDRIFCSPAVRALQTSEGFVEASGFKGQVEYTDGYYMAEPNAYVEPLKTLPDDVQRVMLIGHNPGLEALLQMLTARVESLSTGAIAYLVLPIKHWEELDKETEGELVQLWIPGDVHKKDKDKDKDEEKEKDKEKGKEKSKARDKVKEK